MGTISPGAITRTSNDQHASQSVFKITSSSPCQAKNCMTRIDGLIGFNTLRPRQMDAIFKWTFLNENVWILIKISLKFVPKGPINNISALVQIIDWHHPGNKPLSEPMMVSMVSLPMHICVIQWVNSLSLSDTIWPPRSGSILVQVNDCCLTAPSHYLNQCWLIRKVHWHSSRDKPAINNP